MNKINKIRYSKKEYALAKHLSMYFVSFVMMVATFIMGRISNFIFYQKINKSISINDFKGYVIEKANVQTHIYRWILIFMVVLIFLEVSYAISIITKSSVIGIIVMFIYTCIVPVMGKWDLKNSIFYLYNELFDFKGVINVQSASDGTNYITSILLGIIVLMVSFSISYICEAKRSAYEI